MKRFYRILAATFNFKIHYLIFLVLIAFACSNVKPVKSGYSNTNLIYNFYAARNISDFSKLSTCISGSILWVEANFTIASNKQEYYENFRWDSVFNPTYTIIDFDTINENTFELEVAKICDRIQFLHDSATVMKQTITIENGLISNINTTDFLVFDFEKWSARRDTLVNWVNINHPELNGYINDITFSGADNYMKAIELYRASINSVEN